jgi:hypothetical protein
MIKKQKIFLGTIFIFLILYLIFNSNNIFLKFSKKDSCKRDFDFNSNPILIGYNSLERLPRLKTVPCDIGCKNVLIEEKPYHIDGFFTFQYENPQKKLCSHQKTIYNTMENSFSELINNFDIKYLSRADTDIYASYLGKSTPISNKLYKKKRKKMASAYITNCEYEVTSKRIELIYELLKHGITIGNYTF